MKQALDKGYDGIRVVGYVPTSEKEEWIDLTLYEIEINKALEDTKVLALCIYPLDRCSASKFIDIMSNHRYAFIAQRGTFISFKPKTAEEMDLYAASLKANTLTPLMKRFAVSGLKDFSDEEIIELMMRLCSYDSKEYNMPRLMANFKNVRGLLAAFQEELKRAGLNLKSRNDIKLLREIPARVLKEKIKKQPVYDSPQAIFNYLYYSMRDLEKEVFKVMFLNARSQIMEIVDLFQGTTDKIFINPREVIENAMAHKTKALVFVHNHPSGDPTPSQADKRLTRDLVFAGNILEIRVLDHIIIGENRYFSFASEGLIKEYETDFLNLKLTRTAETRRRLSEA